MMVLNNTMLSWCHYDKNPPTGEAGPAQDGLSRPWANFRSATLAWLGREKLIRGQPRLRGGGNFPREGGVGGSALGAGSWVVGPLT